MAVATETAGQSPPAAHEAATLWAVLGTIFDRRGRRGRQYPLQPLHQHDFHKAENRELCSHISGAIHPASVPSTYC